MNEKIQPDKFYPLSDASELLSKNEKSLRDSCERGTLKIVKSGNIPGIIGNEILRYSKRPTKNAIYTYERLLNYIPGLNKEDYNAWIIKMRNEQRFGYHITEIKTEGICLRLPAAQRFYADMTMNQSPL